MYFGQKNNHYIGDYIEFNYIERHYINNYAKICYDTNNIQLYCSNPSYNIIIKNFVV